MILAIDETPGLRFSDNIGFYGNTVETETFTTTHIQCHVTVSANKGGNL